MPLRELSQYQQILILARRGALRRLQQTQDTVLRWLEIASEDLRHRILLLDTYDPSEALKRAQMTRRFKAIQELVETLGQNLSEEIRAATLSQAQEVATMREDATRNLVQGNLLPNQLIPRVSFSRVPTDVMGYYAQRSDVYGLRLSPRKWATGVQNAISREIGSALASGKSAEELSRRLKLFLLGAQGLDPDELEGLTGGLPTGQRLSLAAHAKMTARTEINNAYWEASARSAELSPVVSGLRWNLSASHAKRSGRAGWDGCDLFAGADLYGLGKGVYPTNRFPIPPHPNCLCYSTDVLRDPSEWEAPKPAGTYSDTISLASLPPKAYALLRGRYTGNDAPRQEALQVLEDSLKGGMGLGPGITRNFLRSQISGFRMLSGSVFERSATSAPDFVPLPA